MSKETFKQIKQQFPKAEDHVIQREVDFWQRLRTLLKDLNDKQKANVTQQEMCSALNISRVLLSEFLAGEEKRRELPITYVSLNNLWNSIIEPELEFHEKLKAKNSDTRREIKDKGFENFLADLNLINPRNTIDLNTNQHLLRKIITMLESNIFNNEEILDITEDIEKKFTRAAKNKYLNKDQNNSLIKQNKLDRDSCINLGEEYLKRIFSIPVISKNIIQDKFSKAITKIEKKGHKTFTIEETIGVLMSILDKECSTLPQQYKLKKKLRIKDFQFNIISFDLLKEIDKQEDFPNELTDLIKFAICKAEMILRGEEKSNSSDYCDLEELLSPMLDANFICRVADQEIILNSRSCATSLGNMFAAIEFAMGSSIFFKPALASIHAIDDDLNSLARCSVTLEVQKKSSTIQYIGTWVDMDSILSSGQAFICAIQNWIIDEINDQQSLDLYYDEVKDLALIDNRLKNNINTVFDHEIQNFNNKSLYRIKDDIEQIKNELQHKSNKLFNIFRNSLDCLYELAIVNISRKELISGNVTQANRLLDINQRQVRLSKNAILKEQLHISYLFEAEESNLHLYIGHNINDLSWEVLDLKLEKLGEFALSQEKSKHVYSRHLSFDVYLAASELCGSYSRISFYTKSDTQNLSEALYRLLMASQYASRIGLKRKVARWLSLAARVSIRLGNKDFARHLIELADSSYDESNSQTKEIYIVAIKSELVIAKGEHKLYYPSSEEDKIKSLNLFIEALFGAIFGLFARRSLDSIYNIARVSERNVLTGKDIVNSFKKTKQKINWENYSGDLTSRIDENNNTAIEELFKFVEEVSSNKKLSNYSNKKVSNLTNQEIRKLFIDKFCSILNSWHSSVYSNRNSKHIFCSEIKNNFNFLKPIVPV